MDLNLDCQDSEIPLDSLDDASLLSKTQLPEKSQNKYNEAYVAFMQWKDKKNHDKITEPMMLEYFHELANKYKPSTLWAKFSMLKSTIILNNNLCIGRYKQLIKFLKVNSNGFKSKQSNYLSPKEIREFMTKAPDSLFLATKVALIFGVCGACRSDELTRVTMNDIKDHNGLFLVTVPSTSVNTTRSFTIDGDFYRTVQKYMDLRPSNVITNRFFLNYQNGKCTVQVIGKNKFARMPKQIARFLELPDPDSYTGHSFRKTSSLLASSSLSKRKAMNHQITASSILHYEQQTENFMPAHKKAYLIKEASTSNNNENICFQSNFDCPENDNRLNKSISQFDRVPTDPPELITFKEEFPDEDDDDDEDSDDDPLNDGDENADKKMYTVMLQETHEEESQMDVFSILYNESLSSLSDLLPNERWGVHKQGAIGDKMSAIVFSIIDYISNDLRLAPVHYKQLILYDNLNAQIYFYNMLRSEFSTSVSNVKELRTLIKKVDGTNLCRGGPSVLQYEDAVTNIALKEEASHRWRHTSCLVVLEKGVCCKMCFSLHETLRKLSNHSS